MSEEVEEQVQFQDYNTQIKRKAESPEVLEIKRRKMNNPDAIILIKYYILYLLYIVMIVMRNKVKTNFQMMMKLEI